MRIDLRNVFAREEGVTRAVGEVGNSPGGFDVAAREDAVAGCQAIAGGGAFVGVSAPAGFGSFGFMIA
jgi:hypothetical protein